jgi:hypothetical protein
MEKEQHPQREQEPKPLADESKDGAAWMMENAEPDGEQSTSRETVYVIAL